MREEFTIFCNYIDPPDPPVTHEFISEKAARDFFQMLVEIEREVNAGGEWEIILYRNQPGSALEMLDRFSYTDLLQEAV